MKQYVEKAVEKFKSGYNCAQSAFYPFCEAAGLDLEPGMKLSCGLGGGMGRTQQVCGAVTGGILALGLKYGRGMNDTRAATEATYEKVRELISRFEAKHGTCVCRELLKGCDMLSEEGMARIKAEDMHSTICEPCVASVVEIVADMLART